MEIDVHVERLGEVEDACEMGVRVGVRVGTAADHLAAVAQRLDQKLLAAGIVGEAFLREDTERQVDRPGIVKLQRLHRLEAAQADARIDLDVGSHARGAVDDGTFEHLGAARVDVLDREILLHPGDGADRFRDAAVIMPAAAEQAGLVQMDVAVHEAGQGERPPTSTSTASQASVGSMAVIRPRVTPMSIGSAAPRSKALRKMRSKAGCVVMALAEGN